MASTIADYYFLCMFIGAMAGSTGGAIKIMRIILLAKHGYQEIFRLIHPHAVRSIKLGGKPVPAEVLNSVWGFFILYLGLFIASVIIMSLIGLDIPTSFASVAATIGNVGPGFGLVGPVNIICLFLIWEMGSDLLHDSRTS